MNERLPPTVRLVADALRRAATASSEQVLTDLLGVAREQARADFALLLVLADPFTAEVYAATPMDLIPGGVVRPDLIADTLATGRPRFGAPAGVRIPPVLRGEHAVLPLGDQWALLMGRRTGGPFDAAEQQLLVDLCAPLHVALRWDVTTRELASVQARFDAVAGTLPHALLFIDNNDGDAWANPAAAQLLDIPAGPVAAHVVSQAMARLHRLAGTAIQEQAAQLAVSPDNTVTDWRWMLHSDPPRVLNVSTAPVHTRHKQGRLWLFIDITAQETAAHELRAANAQLLAAREAADAANRAKSLFLANMSHELRTPLNAIVGLAQVMQDDPSLTPAQRENFDIIVQSSDHLLTMINEVLDISKIEAGKMELHEVDFDLHATLRTLQAMLQQKAANKGLRLVVEIAPDVPVYVHADQGKLRQVLINLLNNAIKFTAQGSVTLRVRMEAGGQGLFIVEDTGAGIAPEEMEQLFSEFEQTASGRHSQEGTGLGLPISRKFIQMMGGEITVHSRVGQGTTFTVRVPLPPALSPDLAGADPGTVIGLAPDSPHVRVLIVDDIANNRTVLRQVLQPLALSVREAADGAEALALWEAWRPDLVWLDIRMRGIDGMEVARTIRRREAESGGLRTCIIAITASVMAGDHDSLRAAGCDDIVPKPFRRAQIFDLMARHLGLRYLYRTRPTPQAGALPEAALPALSRGSAPRVLVVDDNSVGRKLTERLLQKLQIDADVAANGEEAIHALRTYPYPLVFMDMQMPVMDGLEATRRIRAEWGREHPVIIALTGEEAGDIQAAQETGIDGWLVKPLRIEDLRLTVERWLTHAPAL